MPSDHKIENDVETYLVRELNKINVPCEKYKSVHKGDPDRITFPGEGYIVFIETKVRKNGLSPHQLARHKFWIDRLYGVFIARTKEDVDKIVESLQWFKANILHSNETIDIKFKN